MATKPSIPKGTRDFLPSQVMKRRYIFDTIESVFQTYGYLPIETPTMEELATLTGKYGEEGDQLLFKTVTLINNRKILFGLAETAGIADQFMDMTIAIDKLDKIGVEKVVEEMTKKGISETAAKEVMALLEVKDLDVLEKNFQNTETGLTGIAELRTFHSYNDRQPLSNKLVWDITLARGLNYYTGCIFEVKADVEAYPDLQMGSIGGGGRYDDLTSGFGMKDMSGVGVSFGAERIYDVMEELELFPQSVAKDLDVLIVAFDEPCHLYGFDVVTKLRAAGIKADLYPQPMKMKKQMKYANDRNVPYVIVIGSDEMKTGELTIKDMIIGTQSNSSIHEIINKLQS
eukprot:maker-scaffold293_size218662-snap-gene-1.7 protein:Tk07457 transcript:maker-scaffold293_size218662-snap-gene-1.7-mRNA-1 annotation:"hypothetical protein"